MKKELLGNCIGISTKQDRQMWEKQILRKTGKRKKHYDEYLRMSFETSPNIIKKRMDRGGLNKEQIYSLLRSLFYIFNFCFYFLYSQYSKEKRKLRIIYSNNPTLCLMLY